MIKVITYGTYDLLHYGHIRLLERAKALGDFLIVGVTSDGFDKIRGKINVHQSLAERFEAVKLLGIADEVIVEEYEGQKIDDIRKYNIDIFTVGSDWVGKFDYLNAYCKVVYLPRTEGVSSSDIRSANQKVRLGIVGESIFLNKVYEESKYVNGIEVTGVCSNQLNVLSDEINQLSVITNNFSELLTKVDAIYIHSSPVKHYTQILEAVESGKHVICRSPISTSSDLTEKLFKITHDMGVTLYDSIKTAYCTAYARMILLVKSGAIGKVVSVDSTCTSMNYNNEPEGWTSLFTWGPIAMLPIFDLLGTDYLEKKIVSAFSGNNSKRETFTKVDFLYVNSVASLKVARGAKSEGDLVISGTKGYIYVPSPWWKTDYFEIRYENFTNNRKYFYQLEGEGIRNELASFNQSINGGKEFSHVGENVSLGITKVMEDFMLKRDFREIVI